MVIMGGQPGRSALDAALDIFRMRQYFNVVVRARDVVTAVRRDEAFLGTVRRGLRPLPFDRQPAPGPVFGPVRGAVPPPLTGRVGVVATGGSGALASVSLALQRVSSLLRMAPGPVLFARVKRRPPG